MIKAVIFDVGGVLHKSQSIYKDIADAYGVSQEECSIHMNPIVELFRKGEISEEEFWKKLSQSLKKPLPENSYDLWRLGYERNFVIYPHIIELIKEIRQRGIKTAMLSNTIVPHVEILKKHIDFKLFDVIVFSCEVGLSKSSPAIYSLTVEKLKVKPEECLFIDDEEKRLVPANELGMKTILAQNPEQVIQEVISILN